MLLLGARGARAPLSASVSSPVPGSASSKARSVCSASKEVMCLPLPLPSSLKHFFFWQAPLLPQRFKGYGEEIILWKSNFKKCLSTNGVCLCNGCMSAGACSSARLRLGPKIKFCYLQTKAEKRQKEGSPHWAGLPKSPFPQDWCQVKVKGFQGGTRRKMTMLPPSLARLCTKVGEKKEYWLLDVLQIFMCSRGWQVCNLYSEAYKNCIISLSF